MTEHDPTATEPEGEPDEASLPPKPPVEELPEDGVDATDVQAQDVADDEFMSGEQADDDPTVDNLERDDGA